MSEDIRTELILKLKEVFRSDRSDLDFGIYRILNFRRKEIERFIEEDLVKQAESEFSELIKTNFEEQKAELDALREEINRDFGEGTIASNCEVKRLHDAPKIRRYSELKRAIEDQERIKTQICDVFNHVYEFFRRYYDKGDFISKRLFGGREKYVIPHNGEEVSLYWVNQDQYYIKTSEDYRKYSFTLGDYQIIFKLVDVEVEKNNNVSVDSSFLLHRNLPARFDVENNRLYLFFEHRPLSEEDLAFYEIGKSSHQNTKFDAIVEKDYKFVLDALVEHPNLTEQIKSSGHSGEISELKHHLIQYYKKNDMDYFIHTKLEQFLRRELDFYIKNEVLDLDETISKDAKNLKLTKLKIDAITKISEKIIAFLSQIEKFQKVLFEKKKFVLKTNYCISLDKIPERFYDEIRNNKEQVLEWKQLFKLSEKSQGTLFTIADEETLNLEFLKLHQNLVVDTAFFDDDFKYRLLSSIENIDDFVEGICIKSENWHALNLLEERYRHAIDCIYIDPPYNRQGDNFLYKDKFKHSSWLSMVDNRLRKAVELMNENSVIFTSIDDNEHSKLKLLQDAIFGPQNFISNIVWQKKYSPQNDASWFSDNHDFIVCHAKNKEMWRPNLLPRTEKQDKRYENIDNDIRGPWKSSDLSVKTYSPEYDYPIITPSGRTVYPPMSRCWTVPKEKFEEMVKDNRIWFGEDGSNVPSIKRFLSEVQQGIPSLTIWGYKEVGHNQEGKQELKNMITEGEIFDTPKPVRLLKKILTLGSKSDSTVLDFYAGSGSFGHATLEKNEEEGGKRKYILVEMGDYFESTLKKRLVKSMYSKGWKDGVPTSNEGRSHVFKYMYLEQYEDTLNNILFSEKGGLAQTTLLKLPDYFIQHVLNVETKDSPTRLAIDRFKTPFDYKIKTLHGREEKTEPVDLVETFNYLLGIKVKKIRQYENEQTKYIIVYGEKGEEPSCEKVLIIWRNFDETMLENEKHFIENQILPQFQPDTIYINVDSLIKGAQSIEPKFKELMEP